MEAAIGKAIRMGRMLRPATGRGVMVAYAHGPLMGPIPGMATVEEMDRVLPQLLEADAIILSPGLVRRYGRYFAGRGRPALLVLVDWQSMSRRPGSTLGYEEGATAPLADVEAACAAGADGVMSYLYLGFQDPHDEAQEIARNARIARECRRLGLIHLCETRAVKGERLPNGQYDAQIIKLHTRVAAELGADLIKTKYTGTPETFAEVVASCPAPILIAGGPRMESPEEALRVARDAVKAGAAGVVFGRNIYQHPEPARMLRSVLEAVHGVAAPDQPPEVVSRRP